jgi:hypothetical protein
MRIEEIDDRWSSHVAVVIVGRSAKKGAERTRKGACVD